mmetsp:Transcript_36269/g.103652  ORF Transcript_36269/g.103652 Transcript_36269/m.103652 type:complete len:597 (-) Transcript_36269:73-1863(-)
MPRRPQLRPSSEPLWQRQGESARGAAPGARARARVRQAQSQRARGGRRLCALGLLGGLLRAGAGRRAPAYADLGDAAHEAHRLVHGPVAAVRVPLDSPGRHLLRGPGDDLLGTGTIPGHGLAGKLGGPAPGSVRDLAGLRGLAGLGAPWPGTLGPGLRRLPGPGLASGRRPCRLEQRAQLPPAERRVGVDEAGRGPEHRASRGIRQESAGRSQGGAESPKLLLIAGDGHRALELLTSSVSAAPVEQLEERHGIRPEGAPRGPSCHERLPPPSVGNCPSLRLRALPECKEDLQQQDSKRKMINSAPVLLQKASVRVFLQVSIPVNHQHPGCRREVTGVARYALDLALVLPSRGTHCQPEVQEGKLFCPGLLAYQEVVCGHVPVKSYLGQRSKDRSHLRTERCRCGARPRKVPGRELAPRQRPLQELRQADDLEAILVHAVEPLVHRLALESGHGRQHLVLAARHGRLPHAVGNILRHPMVALQACRQGVGEQLQHLGLQEAGIEHLLVCRRRAFEGQRGPCLLRRRAAPGVLDFPDDAEGALAQHAQLLEGPPTDAHRAVAARGPARLCGARLWPPAEGRGGRGHRAGSHACWRRHG